MVAARDRAELGAARSGAIVENANRISLLRDADGDGVAEQSLAFCWKGCASRSAWP